MKQICLIVFGERNSEWQRKNPEKAKKGSNQRDIASVLDLHIISNLEILNAFLLRNGLPQFERRKQLFQEAQRMRIELLELPKRLTL